MSETEDFAWAVGLYEGEGCASIRRKSGTVIVSLTSTDRDTIERFHRIVGVGEISTYKPPPPRKPLHQWQVSKSDKIVELLTKFIESGYLSERRTEQAQKALDRAKEIKPQRSHRRATKEQLALLVRLGLKEG